MTPLFVGGIMGYENVKAKCLFCNAIVVGNQRFMLRGSSLPGVRGRRPAWLKAKPEYQWAWNGLSIIHNGKRLIQEFYLCPQHNDEVHYSRAFNWTQKQLKSGKVLDFTNPLTVLILPSKEVEKP